MLKLSATVFHSNLKHLKKSCLWQRRLNNYLLKRVPTRSSPSYWQDDIAKALAGSVRPAVWQWPMPSHPLAFPHQPTNSLWQPLFCPPANYIPCDSQVSTHCSRNGAQIEWTMRENGATTIFLGSRNPERGHEVGAGHSKSTKLTKRPCCPGSTVVLFTRALTEAIQRARA